jgi:hypothetical protein
MSAWYNSHFQRAILFQAKNNKLHHPDDYPFQIILSKTWINYFLTLHSETKKNKKETARAIKTNLEITKLLINSENLVGDKGSVHYQTRLIKTNNSTQKSIGAIHTHNSKSPFSITDLSNLLFTPKDLISFCIDNKKNIYLVIRHTDTLIQNGNKKEFIKINKKKYQEFVCSRNYKKRIIGNLLFCRDYNIIYYQAKIHLFSNNLSLNKKTLIKKGT